MSEYEKKALGGMKDGFIFNLESIKGNQHLLVALEHNRRVFFNGAQPKNIDPMRSRLNYVLGNEASPEEIVEYVKKQIAGAKLKQRKNQVTAIEILFSLPPNRHKQDTTDFFFDCFEWLKSEFPCEILSFDVHLDETAPHAHALVFPLVDGRMCGSELKGGKGEMYGRNNRFHEQVASKYGLSRPQKLYGKEKEEGSEKVLSLLSTDPIKDSRVYALVKSSIESDPLPFMKALGLQYKERKKKTFANYFISKGKGSEEHDQEEIKRIKREAEFHKRNKP